MTLTEAFNSGRGTVVSTGWLFNGKVYRVNKNGVPSKPREATRQELFSAVPRLNVRAVVTKVFSTNRRQMLQMIAQGKVPPTNYLVTN